MDIRDFYKSTQDNQNKNTYGNSNASSNKDFSQYQDTINKYKDLSQNELFAELFNQANNLKAQGKLDNNTLNTLATTLAPMLNAEQKQVLNNIIEKLK